MELRHLRYFVTVVSERSFTKAAQKLHVAQPALSRQVRQLEEELGVRLLERSQRGVLVTESGKAFWGEACALLEKSEQAIQVARQTCQPQSGGQLKLGYVWGLFHSLVPPLLEQFRRHAPNTSVHLFDLSALAQAEALADGRLDAGFIGFADEADEAKLHKRKVGTCAFVVALPKAHRAARKARVPLASLADDFFLGISDQTYPGASRQVVKACRNAGFRPKILQTVERGFTILGLVAGGCGIALLPESLKAMPHPGIVFRSLSEPPVADLYLAWRGQAPNPPLREFLSLLDLDDN